MARAIVVSTKTAQASSHKMASQRAFLWFVCATLVYNVGVILWGAYVRATGSGAGCGNHWPLCNGQVLPRAEQVQTMIEFTHRVSSGLALVAVVVLWIWSRVAFPRKHLVRHGAAVALILMLNEALLGASLVLFEHVAQDKSLARVVSLSLHSVNTMLLLGTVAVTAVWAWLPAWRVEWSWKSALVSVALMTMLITGATGAIAALGDTLFPASSLGAAVAEDFSSASHYLLRLRIVHPAAALVAAAVIGWTLVAWRVSDHRRSRRLMWLPGVLLVAQVGLGVLNIVLLAPVWLQIVHLLAADVLWISLVVLSAVSVNRQASSVI